MAALRQRKLLTEENEDSIQHEYRRTPRSKGSNKLQKYFFVLTGFVLCTIVMYYIFNDTFSIHSNVSAAFHNLLHTLGLSRFVYAVIIDAGSTGSRVLAFTFYESIFDKNLKLENELFVQIKPGLSSFADNPKKGAESLQKLLDRAKEVIPSAEWGKTPLAMKATAGLRLLPGHQADALLDEVRTLFELSPFLTSPNSVSIMDGVDEGLFSWFTVNFLLDRLGDIDQTVAALDLGGGSTQITFAPSKVSTLKEVEDRFLHQMLAFQQNLTVYSHSYLGLGLMAARKEILTNGHPEDAMSLTSACINPIVNVAWIYGGISYKIKGPVGSSPERNPKVDFKECLKIAKSYVHLQVDKPAELEDKEINAFSYYFDRATEFGLIDPFAGGKITVADFMTAAKATCDVANTDQPFMCLDLTFIAVLLQDGFGLNPKTSLNLYKQIDGHEISWALGAAFHILQNGL